MKKCMVLFLAICMVFGLVGGAIAQELEAEDIPPENKIKTYVRSEVKRWDNCWQRGTQNIPVTFYVTFSEMEGDIDQWPEVWDVYLGDKEYSRICGRRYIDCGAPYQDCVDFNLYGNKWEDGWPPFYLNISGSCIQGPYVDFVTGIQLDEMEDSENNLQPGELLMCRCECGYNECEFQNSANGVNGGCNGNEECEECSWFHPPYYDVTRYDERPGAQDFFFDVIEGDADFIVRDRWYNWTVETCDDCLPGDVVLWEVCNPCPCEIDDPCIPCGELAGAQVERVCPPEEDYCAEWVDPGFFRMDLCNCNNISQIDLEVFVDCAAGCDAEDRLYGMWRYIGGDECSDCSWEAVSFEFETDCTQNPCEDEECECSISASFSGECGDDSCEPCTTGELCALEDDIFGVGYVLPVMNDAYFFEDELFWEVKTWPCNPCECGMIGFELTEVANAPDVVSPDVNDVFFGLSGYEPNDPEACKLEVSVYSREECPDGIGVFLENGDYWVQIPEEFVTFENVNFDGFLCGVTVSLMRDDIGALGFGSFNELIGLAWAAGDPADFPTEAADDGDGNGDDGNDNGDDGNDNGEDNGAAPGGSTASSDGSSSGCNAGFGAGMLLFLVPLGLVWFKRF